MPSRRALMDALIDSVIYPSTPDDSNGNGATAAALEVVAAQEPVTALTVVVPGCLEWIQSQFFIPERRGNADNPAMQLAPYQRAVLREAIRKDAAGKFVYDTVLWSDIKKSIKSSIAAAVILYRALYTPYGSFKVVANDLKQADSRVFFYIKRAIEMNSELQAQAYIQAYRNRISLDNRAVIEAIPVDPSGEAGGNDDMIEFTELHASTSKAHLQMWTELTLSPTKHGYSQRWIDTYAGYAGESPLLEPMYQRLVQPENRITLDDIEAPDDLELYAVGKTLCLWNTKPRLSWQTPDYYASEEAILLPTEFRRIHRNEWGSSTDRFVPTAWWTACETPAKALDRYRQVVVSLDAAVSGDCFGIVALSRDGDNVQVRYARQWTPPLHGVIDYEGVDGPEAALRELIETYNVVMVVYDENQLHEMMTRLRNEDIAEVEKFPQDTKRAIADKQLRDLIRERRVEHDGSFLDLTAHINNANAVIEGKNSERLRIVKRNDTLKIDLAVCLSMAADAAYEYLED